MLRAYSKLLFMWPRTLQSISAGTIGLCGDAACQFGLEKRAVAEYDLFRGARFFALPAFYIAPILGVWFKILERVGGHHQKFIPLKRVLIDQIVFAPPFCATIIFNLKVMEGYSLRDSWIHLREKYWSIYKRSIQFWPCVQLVNFYLVPLHFRVLIVQIAALFWNTFLSFKTQAQLQKKIGS